MSDIHVSVTGGNQDERALIASATLEAVKQLGFKNAIVKNNPEVDPLLITDTRSLLDIAKQGRPDLFLRPIIINAINSSADKTLQDAEDTCRRLLDSEEHAVESAVPQVAYDAVDVIHGLMGNATNPAEQTLDEAKTALKEGKEFLAGLAGIFHDLSTTTDEKCIQILRKYPDVTIY